MVDSVPFARTLGDIYRLDALSPQTPRWDKLLKNFESTYGQTADFVSRSPGRVNIIGEHIDYSMYSVLPMAITADVLLAVSTYPSPKENFSTKIQIANVQDTKFPAREFDILSNAVEIDNTVHEWTNYFKAGLRGALELLQAKHGKDFKPKSMQILMDGSVPAGGGLSSSAAFVTASALAVLVANGEKEINKTELTELAIVSERAVGVNSGGMDQAASVFAHRGSALYVSLSPSLKARPVQFPKTHPELTFLIAQSFVTSDKVVTAPIHYNLRVVECTLAAAYLNAILNPLGTQLPVDASPLGFSLRGFHDTHFSLQGYKSPMSVTDQLAELIELTSATLTKTEGYTRDEIAEVLGLTPAELHSAFMSRIPVSAERFKLRQRALHVFSEALRVLHFMILLDTETNRQKFIGGIGDDDTACYNEQLGMLLNETQASCRDAYECSCPEIDELCDIALRAGSYGSRLTGAGWGGCSVHLVPADKVDAVRAAWHREYYSKLQLTEEQRKAAVVVSQPGGGSAVYIVPKPDGA